MNLELTWTGRHLDLLLSCLNTAPSTRLRGPKSLDLWPLEALLVLFSHGVRLIFRGRGLPDVPAERHEAGLPGDASHRERHGGRQRWRGQQLGASRSMACERP